MDPSVKTRNNGLVSADIVDAESDEEQTAYYHPDNLRAVSLE